MVAELAAGSFTAPTRVTACEFPDCNLNLSHGAYSGPRTNVVSNTTISTATNLAAQAAALTVQHVS
jgi:hypothetical protein